MKVVYQTCCGVDVHKSFLVATIIKTSSGVQPSYQKKRFSTFNHSILQFKEWLLENDCHDVCMESTGKYWVPVFNLLEDEMNVTIANPKWVKAIKGNKDETKDSKWIGDLFRLGLVPGSYVPCKLIRILREFTGVRLIIGDKNLGMLETIPEVFPDARYQRCTVHFYRNIFSVTPRNKMKAVALMLKAIHAQESKEAAREKALQISEKLQSMKLAKAAKKVEDGIEETLTYMDFPTQHWTRIRTNNTIERLNREIKRRTKAIGAFPDGQSALMLVCARLRHVAATNWGSRRYMNMDHLFKPEEDLLSDIIAG